MNTDNIYVYMTDEIDSFRKGVIKGYILWIWYYLYKPYRIKRKKEAQRRIKICESCAYFWKHARQCNLCLCFMDVKTKMFFRLDEEDKSIKGCSKKYW